METNQLRTALAIQKHGTVNAAAAQLGIAPSSVSERLRRLEAELGAPLFLRSSQGLRPTLRGQRYLEAARRALRALDAAADDLLAADELILVAQASLADRVASALGHPITAGTNRVSVQPEQDRERLLRRVADQDADAALLLDSGSRLGGLGFRAPTGLSYTDVGLITMVLVASPQSPLLGRRVDRALLNATGSLIGREPRCSFWMATKRWLGDDTGIAAVGGMAQVKEWAAAGRGVALLPQFAVQSSLERGELAKLDADPPALNLRLVWNRRQPLQAMRALAGALRMISTW